MRKPDGPGGRGISGDAFSLPFRRLRILILLLIAISISGIIASNRAKETAAMEKKLPPDFPLWLHSLLCFL
jgi:hypothetical protein